MLAFSHHMQYQQSTKLLQDFGMPLSAASEAAIQGGERKILKSWVTVRVQALNTVQLGMMMGSD